MTTTSMNVCPAACSVDFWGSFINRLQIGMHWRDRMMGSFESDWDKFQFRSLRLEENYIYNYITYITLYKTIGQNWQRIRWIYWPKQLGLAILQVELTRRALAAFRMCQHQPAETL
jgi:hypothetical protein